MKSKPRSQAGEGKLGCIVSLAVLIILGAAAAKIGPVYMHQNEMQSISSDLASRAALMSAEAIMKQLRSKAHELDIPEALVPGAIQISGTGPREGTCTIHLKYTQKIEMYGITTIDFETDKTISKPFMDAR